MATMEYRVALPPDELLGRVAAATDPERRSLSWTGFAGNRPFIASVRADGFRLQKRRFYRNSFGRALFARVRPEAGGSVVTAEFRMFPVYRWFVRFAIAFALLIFTLSAGTVWSAGRGVAGAGAVLYLATPLLVLAALLLIVRFSWWLGRREERDLRAFLEGLLTERP